MDLLTKLTSLLPIEAPFEVERIEKDELSQQVHIYLIVDASARPSEDHHLHSYYDRSWEHLPLFQYRSFLHCRLPIYQHKLTKQFRKASVSFARDFSRFTLLYEQEVMRLMSLHHCLSSVARQLSIHVQRVESIYHHYTTPAYYDHQMPVCPRVGYDETSTRKGHDYITTFVDMDTGQLLDIQDGKSAQAVAAFVKAHPYPEAIRQLSLDMSPAFISGANRYLPQASLTFDKWHFYKLLYQHLDELGQKAATYRHYISALMEQVTSFFDQNEPTQARAQLTFIADYAQECLGDNALTKCIYRHYQGVVNYFETRLTNGLLEGINSKIQTLKRVARGFRYKENFKKMIFFAFGNLSLSFQT